MNTNNSYWQFLAKTLCLAFIPLFLLFTYFYYDPFRVLYNHDNYNDNGVAKDADFISTELYKKNKARLHYDSFILGGSNVMAFCTQEWKKCIGENTSPFCYNANVESIYGIWAKVKYLDETGDIIKNVMLCMDWSTFRINTNSDETFLLKHPDISHEGMYKFQKQFLSLYFKKGFFIAFLDYTWTNKKRPYMAPYLEFRQFIRNTETNDLLWKTEEDEIKKDSLHFFKKKKFELFNSPPTDNKWSKQMIYDKEKQMLLDIATIFKKHNTNYVVVLSPMTSRLKFNPADMKIVKQLFGEENVYDYSGTNAITSNIGYWIDHTHFRSIAGNKILSEIYSNKIRNP